MSSKAKLYKIDKDGNYTEADKKVEKNYENKSGAYQFVVGILVYALVLMIANALFKGIYVENFFYAIIAALILSFLNATVKPVLVFLAIPLTILTYGIAYPLVNVIILNICDIIMGNAFTVTGLLSTFVIAIFISFLKIVLDRVITKKVGM